MEVVSRPARPRFEDADHSVAAKPAGAYRPPGARGAAASDAYKRDDDSGPSSGAATPSPMFRGGKPAQRYVPGTAVPGASAPPEDKKKRVRSKRPMKEAPETNGTVEPPVQEMKQVEIAGDEDANAKKIRNLSKKVCIGKRERDFTDVSSSKLSRSSRRESKMESNWRRLK